MIKSSVDDITLSMVEDRIYKKVVLDESAVRLKLSYIPLLVGCEEPFYISDDEYFSIYLNSIDKENRMCILYVEVLSVSDETKQVSRVVKGIYIGMNYDELHTTENENLYGAITLYIGNEEDKEQHEAVEEVEYVENNMDRSDMRDEFAHLTPTVESSQFIDQ